MAISDINRLRQMNLFNQEPIDVMTGGVFGGPPHQQPQQQEPVDPRTVQYPATINQAFGMTGNQPAPQMPQSTPMYDLSGIGNQTGWDAPPPPTQRDPIPFESSDDNVRRVLDAIGKVYTPETQSRDRFNNLLDNTPVRQEPSFARRLVAAGVGLGNKSRNIPGGIEQQEKVLYAPYMRDMAEWTAKTTPFSQASQQENTANVNERTLAGNVVNSIYQNDRVEATNRATQQRAEAAAAKNLTDQQANAIKAAKLNLENRIYEGGVKNVYTKGKFVYVTTNSGKTVNTGIPGEAIDAMELAKFNADAELNEIRERGKEDRETQGATPKAQAAAKEIGMDEFYNTHPEWQKFMSAANGTYSFKKRPGYTWLSGDEADEAEMAQYDQMMRARYGDKYQAPGGGQPGATSPQTQGQTQTLPGEARGLAPQVVPKLPPNPVDKIRELEALYPTAVGRQKTDIENQIRALYTQMGSDMSSLSSAREQRSAGTPVMNRGQNTTEMTIDRLGSKYGSVPGMPQDVVPQQQQMTQKQVQHEQEVAAGTKLIARKLNPKTHQVETVLIDPSQAMEATAKGYIIYNKSKLGPNDNVQGGR